MRSPSQLRGADILFLEDNAIISICTSAALEEMGCKVRAVLHLNAAWDSARRILPDAAVLDVSLQDNSTSLALAEWLDERGVPIIFLTGYEDPAMHGSWNHPRARKPFSADELERLLTVALKNRAK